MKLLGGHVAVFDVGKTNAKLTLWSADGALVARRVRANAPVRAESYSALDAAGIDAWLVETLGEFAVLSEIVAIVPVAHGAAAALVHRNALFAPPMDYEDVSTPDDRASYDADRDGFAFTGSPALPFGLNLGMQLHRLEALTGPWPADLNILLWPQYWAWRLSGVMTSEASSLGCHTDLWRPMERRFSALADRRGWSRRFPPLNRADAALGPITAEWVRRTGLSARCRVLTGLHDSNAALLAGRGHAEIASGDATILSTGTWFVAMRSGPDIAFDIKALDAARDCLVNVDIDGRPAPSARFMGGREVEALSATGSPSIADSADIAVLLARVPALVEENVFIKPNFAPGTGPYPTTAGTWLNMPMDDVGRRAAVELYLALIADTALNLIGSRDRLLIEGRFAECALFVSALAALRPATRVYVSNAHNDVPYGALRLIAPRLAPVAPLTPVAPLAVDLDGYRARWRELAAR